MSQETPTPPSIPTASSRDWRTRARTIVETTRSRIEVGMRKARETGAKVRQRGGAGLRDDITGRLQRLRTVEPSMVLESAQRAFQRQGAAFWGTFASVALCAFFLSDVAALLAGRFIPEPPAARGFRGGPVARRKSLEDYNVIMARNLFNSAGKIPGEDAPGSGVNNDLGGAPVRTTLPFNLIGTMILRDEIRSIATIEDKSASAVYPVRVEDEIPSKARILKIEPRRVIFVNVSSGRREFVELPEDPAANNPRITLGVKGVGGGIEKVAPNQFSIARTEVDKALGDLNNILTQARAVPNFKNGQPYGYKLFQIVPGSIYEKLGLVNGDAIIGLDGQPINDPSKALALLELLKTSSHFELQIDRDGRTQGFTYDIR